MRTRCAYPSKNGKGVGIFSVDVDLSHRGYAVATSEGRQVDYYRSDRSYIRREWRYRATLMHGPYFEHYITFDGGCRGNHRTHEAAMNCAMRQAGSVPVKRLEEGLYI